MSTPSAFRSAIRLASRGASRHAVRIAVALLVAPVIGSVHAQGAGSRVDAVAAPAWRAPVLVVAGAAEPVRLQALKIETDVAAGVAETRVEMTFFNPNSRTLEGKLSFPLGAAQAVTGFALDVNGALREAVPVAKARAEQVFEDITRQRVDPGLLQHTQGNQYELRIYPLEPGKTRTVMIRLSEPAGPRFVVPLAYAASVSRLDVALRFPVAVEPPALEGGASIGLGFVADPRGGFVARTSRADAVLPASPIVVRSRPTTSPTITTETRGDDNWFSASIPVGDGRSQPRSLPRRVQIVWDQSASGADRAIERELALLDAYFRRAGTIDVSLVRVSDSVAPAEHYVVRGGDWSALRRSLQATVYDGASRLGAVVHDGVSSEAIWFSDGLSTWGALWKPAFAVPVYAVSSSPKGDPRTLATLADGSGGRVVDLLSSSDAEARRALLEREARVMDITARGARDMVLDAHVPTLGRVAIAGAFTAEHAVLTLHLRAADGTRSVRTVRVARGQNPAGLAATQWARLTLASLPSGGDAERAAELGQRFRIAGPATSLVVLERVEDYARHGIEPPAELAGAYARLAATAKVARERSEAQRLEGVVRRFGSKVAWWERSFPKDQPKRAEQQIAAPRGGLGGLVAGADNALRQRAAPSERESAATSDLARPASPPSAAPMATVAAPLDERRADAAKTGDRPGRKAADRDGGSDREPLDIAIALKPASADAAWLKRLERSADAASRLAVYLDERRANARSVGFFLEAADWFLARGDAPSRVIGLRALSNLAEMDLHNRQVLRLLGYRLGQAGEPALAVATFEHVLELAPWEPQSHRDLGLALASAGQSQRAVDALYGVVTGAWDGRFPDIDLIALGELNAVVASAARDGTPLDTSGIDRRLLRNLTLDLRVVLAWDADATDVDLHVIDPNGEEVFYGHVQSYQGGRISRDATGGYGPEEFALRVAKPGRYRIEANFYGHRQQVLTTSTGLMLWLSSGFGTADQHDQRTTLRLKSQSGQRVVVGEFEVKGAGGRL